MRFYGREAEGDHALGPVPMDSKKDVGRTFTTLWLPWDHRVVGMSFLSTHDQLSMRTLVY